MPKVIATVSLAVLLVACEGGTDASADGKPTGKTRVEAALSSTVAVGTKLRIAIQDSLSSRTAQPGQSVRAVLTANVTDEAGRIIIPTGSPVTLTIVKLEPGSDQVRPEGRLELAAASVSVRGKSMPLHASVGEVPHHMKGRGITTDEAGRIAAGTAVGAGVGQLIGKNTKGTLIGAAVGAVAGGAVAAKYAYRDIIIDRGADVTLTLTQPISLTIS